MSLKEDEKEILAKASEAPRVSLKDLEDFIEAKWTISGQDLERANVVGSQLRGLTLAIVVLKNGYVLVGHSAVVSLENYRPEIGEKLAYEQCLRQLWALMGFNLRTKIWEEEKVEREVANELKDEADAST